MATSDRFNVLIVEPDSASRGVLKQAVAALTTFHKLFAVGSFQEAMSYTNYGERIDVVIISRSYADYEVTSFIHEARATTRGAEWAYILIVFAEDDREGFTETFIKGVDGFLSEPYSADDIRAIAEIASKVKLLNEENRKRSAILVDLREMLAHIDAISMYLACAMDPRVPMERLRTAADRIDRLRQQYFQIYVDLLIEETQKAQPNQAKSYLGPSERIKRRVQEKALKKLGSSYHE